MDRKKRVALQSAGFEVGSTDEFLELSKEESEYIEIKLALAQKLAQARKRKKITQKQLAKLINSSQSRVAKMEAGDPTVTIDLLVKTHLVLGTKKNTLAKVISGR